MRFFLIIFLITIFFQAFAQSQIIRFDNTSYVVEENDSILILIEIKHIGCKNFALLNRCSIHRFSKPVTNNQENSHTVTGHFSFKGNVLYDYNYKSYLEAPFGEKGIWQQSMQTKIFGLYKETIPFTIIVSDRRTNSNILRNSTDVSIQFRQTELLEGVKNKILKKADLISKEKFLSTSPFEIYNSNYSDSKLDFSSINEKKINSNNASFELNKLKIRFSEIYERYRNQMDSLQALNNISINIPLSQLEIEDKERKAKKQSEGQQLIFDSVFILDTASIKEAKAKMSEEKKLITELKQKISLTEKEIRIFQKHIKDSLNNVRRYVSALKDKESLTEYIKKNGNEDFELNTGEKVLLSIKEIGIGRAWLDYTELTVKNITLSGFHIEANAGKLYFATAVGKVRQSFGNYSLKENYNSDKQNLAVFRLGLNPWKRSSSNLILTYFNGKKSILNQVNPYISEGVQHISGFSVETKLSLNAENYLIAEYAKSVSGYLPEKLFNINNRKNEAISLKLSSKIHKINLFGYFRKMGENFQSFTVFPSGNKQDAFNFNASRKIYKDRILIDASIRKNDFSNPYGLPDFSSSNIFKSIQATLRFPKYPLVTLGYYPSSQLVVSEDKFIYESHFNTFNLIAAHSYSYSGVNMGTNFNFLKFYNSSSDSMFLYYNSSIINLSHSVFYKKFLFQGIYSISIQNKFKSKFYELGLTYRHRNKISLYSAGRITSNINSRNLFGGSAGLNLKTQIGTLKFRYEKIYLPGSNRDFLPVDLGRFTFYREF